MDVSGRIGRRLVLSAESIEGDVVADDVLLRVDAELEETPAVGQATGELVLAVDDFSGGGLDLPSRGKGEWDGGLGLEETENSLLVLLILWHGRSGCQSGEGDGEQGELHIVLEVVGLSRRMSRRLLLWCSWTES